MSHPSQTSDPMANLISTLDLEKLEENLFRGESPQIGWQRVFGGQVIAQALIAAQRTVDDDRFVHSLHSYFMRPGDPLVPILYQVERIRDGASFCTRRVVAIQHGKAIFSMSASFQIVEDGFDHQIRMPDVTPPERLMSEDEMQAAFLANAPTSIRKYWSNKRPIEIRPVSLTHYISKEKLEPQQDIWVRAVGDVPDDPRFQSAILAYLSDMTLLDTSLYAHGTTIFDPAIQVASLDHAMWFHRPCRLDDWLLYTQDSPSASGARGLTRGNIFTRQGELIASVAQEGLIRKRANA
ncbi:acyl-CoA thioesterase II [Agrobacterium tumefaciens]|uniref:Acyl-CoA thioesterase 2 n=1 Tax=Agrobacterium tumefaciens TaxID=358 RepID=A0AA44JE10_AGRTU|nr:acyl-CoA thioesterase II [Agrobacterium tumefaciens]NSL20356.1 acyl-CoA thioesterase II [Agrobacterium tumefaciens]NTB89429.1 acyl-CoA thioesterase II [Agrobacterium tumefaciens]NTC19307.1 acyl-CoA thioesterase II [Agrobacterium tumefaciens]NTC31783.1 acyl-CoA thioesterase II [Agrobacterium tumefaciens]NTC58479.1 acyl-CoA thioesterase II [Agrobacterium tumefaciens]